MFVRYYLQVARPLLDKQRFFVQDMYDISSKLPLESLLKDNHQKDLHIQELKKEVNRFEHILKEKWVKTL